MDDVWHPGTCWKLQMISWKLSNADLSVVLQGLLGCGGTTCANITQVHNKVKSIKHWPKVIA
jgi:hypothetical protein